MESVDKLFQYAAFNIVSKYSTSIAHLLHASKNCHDLCICVSVYMYEGNPAEENWKVKTDRATTTQIVTGLQGGPDAH